MKIGAIADSFRKPLCEAIKQISALKLSGVQMYADNANLNIGMTATQIKEIGKMIDGEGIKVSALCGDIGCDMY